MLKRHVSFIAICLVALLLVSCGKSTSQISGGTQSNKNTILFVGDSITAGLSGTNQHNKKSYPWWVGNVLGRPIVNAGHDGGTISGTSKRDLIPNLKSANYKHVTTVVIGYGINDYLKNRELNNVTSKLAAALKYLKKHHSNVKVIGILPLNAFITPNPNPNTAGDAMVVKNKANYAENELCDNLKTVYSNYGVSVLDWRLDPFFTANSVSALSWDGVLHPNAKGYKIMGLKVASFILQNE
ncbi:SGNH/GDSL hydrolase family protein [Lactiplantibacillus pentosus]|uniref:SGNH/GDSL hydrolase family protein n=1 Tax=Lactiplantibacillus pentosus TaxID=1589 RepID=UPI000EA90506|nr:SGNH/GDSL hydrolase family protein [Lactiplantibacillus pentosus]AYG36899.1 SGNH/GDSL hydrolase family protein [Lactiplantibacillus pentosus]AYG42528.1 SGNH/GDSL hydrolase family protein [Lactiplantibacillus pentosus]